MRMPVALAVALMLDGCAGQVPAPKIETRTVYVPQPVACIDKSKVPGVPVAVGPLPADARQAADILAAAVLDRNATINQLMALIPPCVR